MNKSWQNRQWWHVSGVARDDNKRQVTNSGNRNETLATAASHNNLHQTPIIALKYLPLQLKWIKL